MNKRLISLKTVNNDYVNGIAWECEQPKACIFITTGMEEHAERYNEFAEFLVSNGYSVYSVDHYGQGSNVTDVAELGIVPRSFFSKSVRILDDLVKKYSIKGIPSYILGHSMGSFMVQDYIQRYANHVKKAVIVGSDGDNSKLAYSFGYPLARFVCKLCGEKKKGKFLKSLAIGAYAKSVKNRKTDCDWLSYNEENVQKYIEDPKCGAGSSNGFYRELLKGNHRLYKGKFLAKINKDLQLFIVSGEEDPVGHMGKGPRRLEAMYKSLGIKDVTLKLYPKMRHEILNETDRKLVYQDILKFIQK